MGHDLPRALVPTLAGQIVEHLRRADAAAQGQAGGTAVS
jgi:hypothetical protein